MTEPLVRQRIHLQRPFEADGATALVSRLLGRDVPRPMTFEVHARPEGVEIVMGCGERAVQRLNRLLRGLAPGVACEAATGPDVAAVARVVARPAGLPLSPADPELVVAAIYQALAARRDDEHLALQLILAHAHAPTRLPRNAADPLQPLTGRLINGARPTAPDLHRHLQAHAAETRVDVTLRLGVTAETRKRRQALTWELFGAIDALQAPGVHLSLVRDTSVRWSRATPAASGLRLTAGEVVPLLGWPLGEYDYPGVPGVHPRLLPVPEIVSRTDSVFALGTAPGPHRPVGIDPKSRLQHVLALGPTGVGKSTLLEHLIVSDILAGRACVVVEPKKQLVDSILKRVPAHLAERIVVLDPADHASGAVVGFNPLDVGDRDPDIVVDGILAALAAVFEDGWGPRTEYLIQNALLSLGRANQVTTGDPYTLIDLPRVLTDPGFRRPVVAAVKDDVTLSAFWAELEAMRPAQRAAVLAAPLNKLRKIVLRKPLVAVLGQPSPRFRLRDVFRERKTVLVPLNDAILGPGSSKLLGSLIAAEVFAAAQERATEKDPAKRPGMVFIDEVQNYLHLPTSIEDALAISRSYGVGWHLATQILSVLPPKLRQGLSANARTKLCFTLDPGDAKEIARHAPQLTADDLQQLDQYEIYAHLFAGGRPAGWCSARTLPPNPDLGNADLIRDTSRRLYGTAPAEPTPAATSVTIVLPTDQPSGGQRPRGSHQKARRGLDQ